MTLLIALLVLTVAISASLRLAGFSRKIAVLFGSIPLIVANLFSLSAFMILRTADGRIVSKAEQLLWGLLSSLILPVIVALTVKKKEPNQASEPTSGTGP